MNALTNLYPAALVCALTASALPAELLAERDHIEIHGRLLLDGEALSDAILIVEVNDLECVPFDLYPDGRFELSLPLDAKASIRFEKPGYLSKDVVVDTRNALRTKEAVRKNKLVRFDVQLQPEPRNERMYAGPVGSITFVKGTGLMKVRHDRTLVDVHHADPARAGRKEE